MIGQTNKQTNRDYNFKYIDIFECNKMARITKKSMYLCIFCAFYVTRDIKSK